jgi:hypothetical protein
MDSKLNSVQWQRENLGKHMLTYDISHLSTDLQVKVPIRHIIKQCLSQYEDAGSTQN